MALLTPDLVYDVFPDNPNDADASGTRNLAASPTRVVATGEVNAPVFGPDGKVVLLVHRVEEVTELIRARGGPGLEAAGVMGRLRSALNAASRVAAGPAEALNVLGRYAHVVDGAESATAVTTFIDFDDHTITYSSAGHPPLDARPDPTPRPQAHTDYTGGATDDTALVIVRL